MTQENKELLLKDLCARLPYYPKCEMIDELRVVNNEKDSSYTYTLFPKHIELFSFHNNFTIKPYLRPLSSMTEEERKEYKHLVALSGNPEGSANLVDWLNKKMFAYRTIDGKDMFELSIALKAPERMYNIN
jgi:hypothetical protein